MTWGGRAAHPAVVNPPCPVEDGSVLSLRGEWEFKVQPAKAPYRNGIWKQYYKGEWPDARTIQVPGAWEVQGVGDPGMGEPWDCTWDHNAKPIRHKYRGDVLYRKSVTIPATWKDRRVWLKIGGVKSCGWFWVNDRQVALVDNYCGTYKYEITDLVKAEERAQITVQANNTYPSRKGLMSENHRWGAIYRDIELEATPGVYVDDAWVRGDFDAKTAEVHVTANGFAAGTSGASRDVRVSVEGRTTEAACMRNGELVLRVPLAPFRPWSPECPNLYTARVDLVENGQVVQTRFERFGVRKLEVRGKEFYLNDQPYYFRGFGDDAVYPVTALSPADRAVHRVHLAKAHAAGFNFTRLHTHCELPEYFDAADEMGILIQAELPYYSDVPTESMAFDPVRDVTELYRNFRRHASFAVYSMGNEGSFGPVLDKRLHAYVKAMDPDRLKINQDCHEARINPPEASDYLGGPIREWPRGSVNPDRPFVTHEYLNLCIKLDSRLEKRFTGAWLPPVTRAARRDWLAARGLDEAWGDRLQDAQHALQRHWQKVGIESARADPYCDGHCFWTLVDVVVEQSGTYTAQGLFNPFWESKKGGYTAEEFRRFNAPSCVLADFKPAARIATAGDRVEVDVLFAHYGTAPRASAPVCWRLTAQGRELAHGDLAAATIPLGPARKIGSFALTVPAVTKPMQAALEIDVGGVSNAWDLWLFPKGPARDEILARAAAAGITVAASDAPEAKAARAKGGKLITVDGANGAPNTRLGWWWMGKQVGTAIKPHPALGDFPHAGVLSPLWFRLLKDKGVPMSQPGAAAGDLIVVGEGGQDCFRYLAVRQEGASRVIAANGLALLSDTPEANALLGALVDYLAR